MSGKRSCSNCGNSENDLDAQFCKICGGDLEYSTIIELTPTDEGTTENDQVVYYVDQTETPKRKDSFADSVMKLICIFVISFICCATGVFALAMILIGFG